MEEKNPQLSKVMNDIHQMKGRQENIANVLDSMKRWICNIETLCVGGGGIN